MIWKVILGIVFAVVGVAAAGLTYLYTKKPQMAPASAEKIEATQERLARGRFLYEKVLHCDDCHAERDFSKFSGPVVAGTHGKGGVIADPTLPGKVVAANITPDPATGLGQWSDGEIIRAVREGVDREGNTLFPMMPYTEYAHLSDEDAKSLVVFLRTLQPIRNQLPATDLNFPVGLMIKDVPKPVGTVRQPDRSNKLEYGEYLANVSGCVSCHTAHDEKGPIESMRLGGGRKFYGPNAVVVTANISPDGDTGIGKWSESQFLEKFHQYKEYAENGPPVVGPESFTLMPWIEICQWPEEDLKAVYTYLMSQKPVTNAVETHPGM